MHTLIQESYSAVFNHFIVSLAACVINIYLENSFYIDINKNIISYFNFLKKKKKKEVSLISYKFWETVRGQVAAKGRTGWI